MASDDHTLARSIYRGNSALSPQPHGSRQEFDDGHLIKIKSCSVTSRYAVYRCTLVWSVWRADDSG